jgi:hypothetical protein
MRRHPGFRALAWHALAYVSCRAGVATEDCQRGCEGEGRTLIETPWAGCNRAERVETPPDPTYTDGPSRTRWTNRTRLLIPRCRYRDPGGPPVKVQPNELQSQSSATLPRSAATKCSCFAQKSFEKTSTGQRERCRQHAKACGKSLSDTVYVFSNERDGSRPLVPNHVTKRIIRIRKAVGLDSVRLHDLRHFTTTRLLAEGVPVRTVSGRLVHSNAATTLGVYAHFIEESDRDAVAAIGSIQRPSSITSKARRKEPRSR